MGYPYPNFFAYVLFWGPILGSKPRPTSLSNHQCSSLGFLNAVKQIYPEA